MVGSNDREVVYLLYRYAELMDVGDLEGVADLFAHGRIASSAGDPAEVFTFEGRDAVLAMYEGTVRLHEDGTPRTKHVTSNVIIDVDSSAGTAVARSYYTVMQQTEEVPLQVVVAGRYHDTFTRSAHSWRFDTRTIFVDLVGDVSDHLTIGLS